MIPATGRIPVRHMTALAVLMLTVPLFADHQHVVFDDKTDFSGLKTFVIREGRATTTRPELNNTLLFKKVEDAIRSQLSAKGLSESQNHPDVSVDFSLGEDRPSGPSVTFHQGTLVIELTKPDDRSLVWHGVYTDENSSPGKFAEKLPADVKKILSDYPPKKKK
jgi:hypothetical protein